MLRSLRGAAALAVLLAGSPRGLTAASERDLLDFRLEDLMEIEVISLVKKEQRLARTPAAVSVLTQEDIRRSGATSIPEVLRLVPGLQVARIGANHWAVTARGFNGQYSNKLLVMIDGRSVYTPLFSGVYWDMHELMLEDIDRIEVIRGPGASLWGANAVNGVINILTKPARQTQGGLVTVTSGNTEKALLGFRHGGTFGQKVQYRFFGKYGQRRFLWREAGEGPEGDDALIGRAGLRLDWEASSRDSVSVQTGALKSHSHQVLQAYSPRPPFSSLVYDQIESSGGHAMVRWQRRLGEDSDLKLSVYYDRFARHEEVLDETRDTVDTDFQHRLKISGRQAVLWGFGHRHTKDWTARLPGAALQPRGRGLDLFSAFLEDHLELAPDGLYLTLGGRFERNDFTGFEVQPTARLLWLPADNQAAWAAISRAVRTPSRGERDGVLRFPGTAGLGDIPVIPAFLGNPNLEAENLRALEAGYRVQAGSRFSLEAAGFYNFYSDLVTAEPLAAQLRLDPAPHIEAPVLIVNRLRGETFGMEAGWNWRPVERWRLSGGYTGLRMNLHTAAGGRGVREGHSPRHQFQFTSNLNVTRRLEVDTLLYRTGPLPTMSVPPYTRCDVRLGWRVSEGLEISAGAQNLQGGRHLEFVSETFVRPSRIGRSLYGKASWAF